MVGEDDGKDNDTTMGAAYDASLAREVVNECTTSANVRRVVAHAIEGVTRALGGAHADLRRRALAILLANLALVGDEHNINL